MGAKPIAYFFYNLDLHSYEMRMKNDDCCGILIFYEYNKIQLCPKCLDADLWQLEEHKKNEDQKIVFQGRSSKRRNPYLEQ